MFMSCTHTWTMSRLRRFYQRLKAIGPAQRGVSAIEFAILAPFLSVAVLNVSDVSIYVFQRMEVENATEVAAQAAWKTCNTPTLLPATTNCDAFRQAVTNAVQSTSLGTRVTFQANSPSEGYYCVNSSNALQYVGAVSSQPADCSAAGMPNLKPGDYVQIQTTFVYTPLFNGITIGGLLATPITSLAMMRLG
jgi:Flp pilus assembly protein TadG